MLSVALVAGWGLLVLVILAAARPATAEPEDGVLSGPAQRVAMSGASGRGVLQFGGGSPVATLKPTLAPTANGFVHPGVLVSRGQLDFVKGKIAAGAQPWKDALAKAKSSRLANLAYTPHPAAVLTRATGSATSISFLDDNLAAYTDALVYYYTGDVRYADKSIAILNGWASSLNSVASDSQLDAAWGAEVLPRAAEIMRYTYQPAAGHAALNVAGLSRVMTNVLLPQLDQNSPGAIFSNGNWELSMADGVMNIGVFTDNRAVFNTGLSMWRARMPAYVYEPGDGATPIPAPGSAYKPSQVMCIWATGTGAKTCTLPAGFALHTGMSQETCRDISHVTLGLEAAVNAAETARIQGVDLYGSEKQRLIDGFEFAAKYDLQAITHLSADGKTGAVQDGICGGTLNIGGIAYQVGFEIAFNHFAGRQGMGMPYTQQMVAKLRPTAAALHMDWESLTHPGTP